MASFPFTDAVEVPGELSCRAMEDKVLVDL